MATDQRIVFRQGISSGFAGLEIPKFEHIFATSATSPSDLSISSQTRQDYEPVLSTAAAPLIVSDSAAAINKVVGILQQIRNPVRQDPLVEQGAPPLNYYSTTYGVCFLRGGELMWSNYLPERGVRPLGSEEAASPEEENQFKEVVNILQNLVHSSQAA